MQSFFGSAIVLYVEKLIVQAVKASFHQNALRGRIEENARALWALDKLAAAKRSRLVRNQYTRPFETGITSRVARASGEL